MSFTHTLSTIFALKKDALASHSARFSAFRAAAEEDLAATPSTAEKAQRLLRAVRSPTVPRWSPAEGLLADDKLAELQARALAANAAAVSGDPDFEPWTSAARGERSANEKILDELNAAIDAQEKRYQFAHLFFGLFDEETQALLEQDREKNAGLAPSKAAETTVPRDEMKRQLRNFEEFAFNKDSVDGAAVKAYLEELFAEAPAELKALRKRMAAASRRLLQRPSTEGAPMRQIPLDGVRASIQAYMNSGMLSNADIKTLGSFLKNDLVLGEIANVLEMKLSALGTFAWTHPVPAELVRQLSGKYRVVMRPEILDGVFLSYVGRQWSAALASAAYDFYVSKAWARPYHTFTSEEAYKRSIFFDEESVHGTKMYTDPTLIRQLLQTSSPRTIEAFRMQRQQRYFLTQLDVINNNSQSGYDGDDDDDDDDYYSGTQHKATEKPAVLKQELLTTAITELELSAALQREHAVVRTDYEMFGPSLSHTTIRAVLEFFGVTEEWLDFFDTFLRVPLLIDGETEPRTRARGTPISFALSSFFGESVLFCQDVNVNRASGGRVFLYRMHDDVWFWSGGEGRAHCEQAWAVMEELNAVFGLAFNKDKTGSVVIAPRVLGGAAAAGAAGDAAEAAGAATAAVETTLPPGDIKWGLLKLDAQTGKFRIDQAQVDEHISEMRFQLGLVPSLLAWVRAYNSYVSRYLISNFGRPSYTLGIEHVHDVVATLRRMHLELFPEHSGDICGHLEAEIRARFPGLAPAAIPRGWYYVPSAWGGMGLSSPQFLYAAVVTGWEAEARARVERGEEREPRAFFGLCVEQDGERYAELRSRWRNMDAGTIAARRERAAKMKIPEELLDVEYFPSMEEYVAGGRAACGALAPWATRYAWLVSEPVLPAFQFEHADARVRRGVDELAEAGGAGRGSAAAGGGSSLTGQAAKAQADLVGVLHGQQLAAEWGGLRPVWEACLPVGLIELWSRERSVWR